MNKIYLMIIILAVIIGTCLFGAAYIGHKAGRKLNDSFIIHLNEKVIIDKDTLTIIDYSMIDNNFTLSNGKTISKHIIEK